MFRRAAFVTVALALVLPAGAAASGPAATGAGPGLVVDSPASGLAVTSLRASKSGRTVTARVRWDRPLIRRRAARERFTVRVLSGPAGQRRLVASASRRAPRGTSETVRLRLSAGNARRVRSSSRVIATATQQFDGPDADRLYEINHVAIGAMAGKRPFAAAAASSCPKVIKPGTDMTGCQLPGANLAGANLSKVNFYQANLEVSLLAGADLRTSNLTQTDLTGAQLTGARMNSREQEAMTFPKAGRDIGRLIATAKTSVDVIIFDFAGPNIVGQKDRPGALMKAVRRGVNVRVIVNSSSSDCASADPKVQRECAEASGFDGLYAAEQSLKWAHEHPTTSRPAGKYRIQFSSQNFQITHQKTILIDTSDSSGNPRSESEIKKVPTAMAMVSTGNLKSAVYRDNGSYAWGDYKRGGVVVNPNYLTNPAASCLGGAAGCTNEWAARDFAIQVTRPSLVARIAEVYAADQSCKSWSQAPVYRKLLKSKLQDTWANGTLLAGGASYPSIGTPAFYAGTGPNVNLQYDPANPGRMLPQGNSRQRQIGLIDSAQRDLIVYNEEMADADIANALVRAAKRLGKGKVRVVMASDFDDQNNPTPKGEGRYPDTYFFSYLVANDVSVNFLPKDVEGVDYIHAKAIVADGLNAFMGSENFGYASMNYNRELGLMLTNSTDRKVKPKYPSLLSVGGIAAIRTAFESDWNNSRAVAWKALTPPKGKPFVGFPDPDYPQPPNGTPFKTADKKGWNYNMSCLVDPGGDLYQPSLPARSQP